MENSHIAFEMRPLQRLLAAYARPEDRDRHDVIHVFDARLADIVRTTTEPLIGQMRLTWWHDVLMDETGRQGRGDPVADALRRYVLVNDGICPDLLRMIDGWERLLEPLPLPDDTLRAYGEERGGGLFHALAVGEVAPSWIAHAGAGWALWDLSGHVSDPVTRARAIVLAQQCLSLVPLSGWPRTLAPLRIVTGLARHDVKRNRPAPVHLTMGQYVRIIRLGLLGR